MADASDDKKASDSAVLDATLLATPGSSGGGRPVPADASALEVDSSDRYALGEVHAAGGLGRVVRARDRRLHRTVAVKELLQRTPAAEARFVREALITAQLEHPGIVPVHDAGRWPSGEPYYSMKLVSGRTLRDLIQARKGLDERLALIPNAIAVAEAIAYAHSRDVIHRDIKPPNVLVGDFGETLVIDWGLAKDLSGRVAEPEAEAVAAAAGSGGLATAAGNVMGTPAYMAPEQARGEEVDARADVYALGALLYELLTGQPPHGGDSVQDVLASAQKGQVVPVEERQPDAPPDLRAIVRKAMAPERAERYPTAMEMAADLRRFHTGQLVTARHYSTPALLRRWVARHRGIVMVVAFAALALAVVGVAAVSRVMAQRNRAEREMHAAEAARDELIFHQADSLLERDPTAALAWMKRYPPAGERAEQLGSMIDTAISAGVARHVLRHQGWVMRVTFKPDGTLLTVDQLGNLTSWDPATGRGRPVVRLRGEYAEFSPDGSLIAVAPGDGSIDLQPTDGGPPRNLTGLKGTVRILFSRDGRRLLGMGGGGLRVWEVATGAVLLSVSEEHGLYAELSEDGSRLYVARPSGEIAEIAVGSDRPARIALRLPRPAYWIQLVPGGDELFINDVDHVIKLVHLASGRVRELGRHAMREDGWVAFSNARDRVAIALADSSIALYDLATGRETLLRGHSDPAYRVEFSRDDRLLFSASDDATARIWDLVTGEVQVLRGHTDDVGRLAVSPDGRWLATVSFDQTARLWPIGTGPARVLPGTIEDPDEISYAAGGARLLAGNLAGEVQSFETATGKSIRLPIDGWKKEVGRPVLGDRLVIAVDKRGGASLYEVATGTARPLPMRGHDKVVAVAISGDDTRAVTVDLAGNLLLWDLASGAARPVAVERAPRVVSFLPGRSEVLLAGDGFLQLWDLEKGRAVARAPDAHLTAHVPGRIYLSGDGNVIASYGQEGDLIVWNLSRNRIEEVDLDDVLWIALSPDGSQVAIALGNRTVEVLQVATGAFRVLSGHTDLVHQVAFSPDGKLLASCSYDRTVRLWRLDSGSSRVLRGHGREVKALAFTSDGGTLASIGGDGTVRLWRIAALPDDRPSAVPARLAAATSAVIDGDGQAVTRSP